MRVNSITCGIVFIVVALAIEFVITSLVWFRIVSLKHIWQWVIFWLNGHLCQYLILLFLFYGVMLPCAECGANKGCAEQIFLFWFGFLKNLDSVWNEFGSVLNSCFGRVLKRSLSALLMQVKSLLCTFYLTSGSHTVSIGNLSEWISNFWIVWFFKTESKQNFGFPHIPRANVSAWPSVTGTHCVWSFVPVYLLKFWFGPMRRQNGYTELLAFSTDVIWENVFTRWWWKNIWYSGTVILIWTFFYCSS